MKKLSEKAHITILFIMLILCAASIVALAVKNCF